MDDENHQPPDWRTPWNWGSSRLWTAFACWVVGYCLFCALIGWYVEAANAPERVKFWVHVICWPYQKATEPAVLR